MTLADLEKRIKVLEDIEEIKKLQVYYCSRINPPKWDEIKDCFSRDAVFDAYAGRVRGREEVGKTLTENVSRVHIGTDACFMVHPIVEVEGDKAKGGYTLFAIMAQPRKMVFRLPYLPADYSPDWVIGDCHMEYVREDGKWKISSLKWRCDRFSPVYDRVLEG